MHLCGGVDIRADQSLVKNWEQAALGLLAFRAADVDEVVDISGGGWG
jgi:hypothetical protein